MNNYNIGSIEYQQFSQMAYKDNILGVRIKISGKKWEVIALPENNDMGMQAYALAPLDSKGVPDTSKITITYRGTEGSKWLSDTPEFTKDVIADVKQVVFGNISGTAYKDFSKNSGNLIDFEKSQFQLALDFAQELKTKYPKANIDYTGHSLGGGLAGYVAAEMQASAVIFAGPNFYRLLSKQAKENLDVLSIHNFTFGNDIVGNFGQFGAQLAFTLHTVKGNKGHSIKNFADMYDEFGTLITEDSLQLELSTKLSNIDKLKHKWMNRGVISKNQIIFLDQAEALAVLNNATSMLTSGFQEIAVTYQNGINQAEKHWNDALDRGLSIGTSLTYAEVLGALSDGGATQNSIVHETSQKYEENMAKLTEVLAGFNTMISQLTQSINELAAFDESIADAMRAI